MSVSRRVIGTERIVGKLYKGMFPGILKDHTPGTQTRMTPTVMLRTKEAIHEQRYAARVYLHEAKDQTKINQWRED